IPRYPEPQTLIAPGDDGPDEQCDEHDDRHSGVIEPNALFELTQLFRMIEIGTQRMNRAHAFLVDHAHIDRALSSHLEEPRMRTSVVQSVLRRQRDMIIGRAGRRLLLMPVRLAAHMSHSL